MPGTPIARLLIVDDEAAQMKALHETLEAEGYSAAGFTSAGAALAAIREQAFDLALTDLMMPEMDGVAFLRAAFAIDPTIVGIVMTGHGTLDTAVKAMQAGALDYILKPFRLSAILPVLTRSLAMRRVRMENIELHQAVGMYELSKAIGLALDFDTVLEKVADAAMSQSRVRAVTVLLIGGTGADELHVAATRGENTESLKGMRIPFSAAISEWLSRLRERPGTEEPGSTQSALPPMPGISGNVSIAMMAAGKLIGILNFTFGYPQRPIASGQIKALHILASAAASALEAASLLEQVRGADQQYLRLAENAPDIIFHYDLQPAPHMAYVNQAVTSITGYSPDEYYADADLLHRMVHPDDRALMEKVLRGENPSGSSVGMRCVHRNGNEVWIEQNAMHVLDRSGSLIAIEAIARDVTDRKHLEEQLRHSQKMEAIGLLAGGVAHDFNNLLTVILGYSELILTEAGLTSSVGEKIDQIKKASLHAGSLTRQLLAFGRRQIVQPVVLDVNTVVESVATILGRIIGADIELVTTLDPELGLVKVDPDQIEQILMNLAVNARDAMPGGGVLTIETRNATPEGQSGRYSMLIVRDTGSGMDAATQSRIFEPFFTTKEPGKGTGLGLSIVYAAVTQNGGTISVESKPGKGTGFSICLPQTEESGAVAEAAAIPDETAEGGSETVLLVDDNAAVRGFVAIVLRGGGYEVLEAEDGNEALEVCRLNDGQIGLVLTDMVMPQMSGTALVEKLKEINSAIRVLYMSGYAGDTVVSHGSLDAGVPFIQKPFSSASLLVKVREALDRRAGGDAVMSARR